MRTTTPSTAARRRRRALAAALAAAVTLPVTSFVAAAPATAQSVPAAVPGGELLPGNLPSDDVVLFSATGAGRTGGVSYDAADVLRLDRRTGAVALVLDGSDVGLTGGVDGLALLTDGSLLLSADTTFAAPGLGAVEPEDVVRFVPRALGAATAGSLSLLLDGSDVGLDRPVDDVDGLAVSPDGRLLVSMSQPTALPGLLAGGSDLIALEDATYGAASAGRWTTYLDGHDLGLRSTHDRIGGASVAPTADAVFLSTAGRTTPPAVPADVDQVLRCTPQALAPDTTSCALSLLEDLDVPIDALHVGTPSWLDEDCEAPSFDVAVTSHAGGELVDTSAAGNGTGSFVLRGRAPVAAVAVTVTVAGESAPAQLTDTGCGVTWTREVAAVESGVRTFTVSSTGPTGARSSSVALDVRAPGADDVLVTPTFADTPQLTDQLRSYDPATGVLVFDGDATGVLQPGDGLGAGPSDVAPQGYLRIVLAVAKDGTTTRVTTRQAGLTELVRQVEVDHATEPGSVEPIVIATQDAPPAPVAPSAARSAGPSLMSLVPVGPNTDVDVELQLDPGVQFELDVDWDRDCWFCLPSPSLERLWFEGSLELQAKARVVHQFAALDTDEVPFGPRYDDVRLGGVTIPTPVGIPIVITFEAESQAFYELSLSAALKIEYGITMRFVAGFEYDADGGDRGAYRDADVDVSAPSIDDVDLGIIAQAGAGVEVDFEVLLYGQGGIEIEARPRVELEIIGDVIERAVKWDLKLVVPVDGALEVEIELGPVEWSREFGDLDFVTLSLVLLSGRIDFDDDGGGSPDGDLDVTMTGPPGAFPGQVFSYVLEVENTSSRTVRGAVAEVELPDVGSFVSSSPASTPAAPTPGSAIDIRLGDIAAGDTATATVRWKAPATGDVVARASAVVRTDGLPPTAQVDVRVPIGLEGVCDPCGTTAAGTGLRNRAEGAITVTDVPAGATVTRAVLHWGVLYTGARPRDTITLDGTDVRADVTATVSGNLCWGDSATVGYTADVTSLVTGNGTYRITDPVRGITRPDGNPTGVLPYTDGATLVLFYVGGGATSQVLSDFTYGTNTAGPIVRSFDGISSRGLGAQLTLAGPDGQGNGGEVFTISGGGAPLSLANTWNGSDPQSGPSFGIGNLWDTDTYDVSAVLPEGQTSLTLSHQQTQDCIGIGAAVLEVEQR